MIEALWSVEFVSNVQGHGAGVAVLETGRVLGGYNQYTYVGSYNVENRDVEAKVTVSLYAGEGWSIFGNATSFNLQLTGKLERAGFEMRGHVVENPSLEIGIKFRRVAELP